MEKKIKKNILKRKKKKRISCSKNGLNHVSFTLKSKSQSLYNSPQGYRWIALISKTIYYFWHPTLFFIYIDLPDIHWTFFYFNSLCLFFPLNWKLSVQIDLFLASTKFLVKCHIFSEAFCDKSMQNGTAPSPSMISSVFIMPISYSTFFTTFKHLTWFTIQHV